MTKLLLLLTVSISCSNSIRLGYLTTSAQDERSVLQKCLPKRRFEIISLPSCQNYSGIENAALLYYTHNVDIIVADECDEEYETLSRLINRWHKLFVTFGHTPLPSPDTSTLIFAPNNPLGVASGIAQLAEHANWDQVAFLKDRVVDESLNNIYRSFEHLVEHNWTISIVVDGTEPDWVEQVAANSRILFIIAHPTSLEKIFTDFYSRISIPLDFIIVFVNLYSMQPVQFYMEVSRVLHGLSIKARTVKNVLLLGTAHFDTRTINEFAFSNRLKVQPFLENYLLLCDLFTLLFSLNTSAENPLWYQEKIVQKTGMSGNIFLHNGVRYSYLKLFSHVNGKPEEIADIIPENRERKVIHSINGTENFYKTIASLPQTMPECGFTGEKCPIGHIFLIAGIIICVISIPLGVAFYLQRKEDELIRMPWRVGYEQLVYKQEAEACFKGNLGNPGYRRISAYSDSTSSQDDRDTARRFAYVGNVKVSAQHFHQRRAISFSRTEMERLNQIKSLNHSNINPFIGMTFNQNSELVILWSYCIRGSLDDVCFGTGKRLGRNFQSTFLKHILHGLKYLHNSPIKAHGSLFLTNCVVDSYWVVRLTDFGVNAIIKAKVTALKAGIIFQMETKELLQQPPLTLDMMPKKYLQLPPESLAILKETQDFYAAVPSVEGDIYQFGMILYQILFYRRPFRERKEDNEEIINLICDSERKTAVRPLVTETKEYSMRLLSIMQQCWLHKLEYRPPLFKIIDAVAREFGHSAKGTLIDQMITMIDEYSANLEEIVSERTKELEELQEKTEILLYRLMPKNIANSLRDGLPVRPQLHVAVSLLVCDICRFTAICESCIPEHIIDILQSLYSSFDQIISEYNCFKVENVGDAYLLVSGIPEMLDHTHLMEIARISLDIQKFMQVFVAPHKPELKLQIKMGIACGAVASGILGSISPRFCLFGDTVNMACRMASTGISNKIQITEPSQNILESKFPDFVTEERGIIEIKGKAPSMTFWLVCEKPPPPVVFQKDDVFLDVATPIVPKSGRSIRSWKATARGLKF